MPLTTVRRQRQRMGWSGSILIQNTQIRYAQLTGILVGWNHAWKQWATSTPTANGCDASNATAEAARIPKNIKIRLSSFLGHWTGTIALDQARNTVVWNNFFLDNYNELSYDGAGGTVLDGECVTSTTCDSNYISNWGISENVGTSAFEAKGLGTAAARTRIVNNTIVGQPFEGIDLASVKYAEVSGNVIQDASRHATANLPGIAVRNVGGWRGSNQIQVSGNWLVNSQGTYMEYGIMVGGCQPCVSESCPFGFNSIWLSSNGQGSDTNTYTAVVIKNVCKVLPLNDIFNSPQVPQSINDACN